MMSVMHANDVVKQTLSKTNFAEQVPGGPLNLPETVTDTNMFNPKE
jgi:hypothetical protein